MRKPLKDALQIAISELLAALAVMLLWNWVVISVFDVTTINFLQALGLIVIVRLLVGNLGFWRNRHPGQKSEEELCENPLRRKWQTMSDEEKAEFVRRREKIFGKDWTAHWVEGMERKESEDVEK